MRIEVDDIYSTIHTEDQQAIGIVRSLCRARPSGYYFMKKYKQGFWDGYISLMDGRKFPTGLLHLVCAGMEGVGYKVQLSYVNKPTPRPAVSSPNVLHGITLRDYQLDATNRLLYAKRGVAKMATNSGKTEVMAAMLYALRRRALIVVHRKELLYQTAERIGNRLDTYVGLIGDGNYETRDITVAMVQTLSNLIEKEDFQEWVIENEVLMIDECHNASSNQMMDVLNFIPGGWRYGFSGTPLKYEDLPDLKLIGSTGPIIVEVTNEELIEEGYSAEPIVHIHIVEDFQELKWTMDYHDAYELLIVENDERNRIIADISNDSDGVVLVIVSRIAHGELLKKMIEGAKFVHGGDSTEYRRRILEEMRSGKAGTFIATSIFDEGVDVPAVNTLIIAAGGRSHVKLLQRVGRGLRKKKGRNILHIHDFLDDTNKHLLNHSEERIDVYDNEGFEIRLHDAPIGDSLQEGTGGGVRS